MQRVETRWHLDEDSRWRPVPTSWSAPSSTACWSRRSNDDRARALGYVSSLPWPLLVVACVLLAYTAFVAAVIVAGRGQDVRRVAAFIRDSLVLLRRLLGDPRVRRRHKLLLGALIGYLAFPFDLVPDFIPVAGHLDDAVAVALALRVVLRGSGPELLRDHWPGPESSLAVVLRLAGTTERGREQPGVGLLTPHSLTSSPP